MSATKNNTSESGKESGMMAEHARRVLAEQERQKAAKVAAETGAEAAQVADAIDGSDADPAASWAEIAAAAAMAEEDQVAVSVQEALAMRHLCPSPTWPTLTALGRPKGERWELGRFMGIVRETEKVSVVYEGKPLESTALIGAFGAIAPLRGGEIFQGRRLFLGRAFSEAIASALASAKRQDPAATIHINVDVGMESTGKQPVSYAWTLSYVQNGIAIRALRDALTKPRKLTGTTTKQLPDESAA